MDDPRHTIAIVVPKYGRLGGGEKFTFELTRRIAATGKYHIHVFANRWEKHSEPVTFHKVPIISFPKFLTTYSFAWFVNRSVQKMNPDLVHSHERVFHADIFTMHSVPHQFWVKEVREKHMSLFDHVTAWVESQLILNGRCKWYLPVSSLTKEKFLQQYNVDSSRVKIIAPGVDVESFDRLNRDECRSQLRKKYGLSMKDTVLLFVSMNFELKGLDQIIASLARLKIKRPSASVKLLVVGKGNIKKYKQLAASYKIENDVIFTGVWRENIQHVYLASDIFIMLSKFDTFGIVVLEAMAASLPVIVSDNVGAKDLIQEGTNGHIVPREDLELISARIERLLDENVRIPMGQAARQEAVRHSWENVAQEVTSVYKKVLKN